MDIGYSRPIGYINNKIVFLKNFPEPFLKNHLSFRHQKKKKKNRDLYGLAFLGWFAAF